MKVESTYFDSAVYVVGVKDAAKTEEQKFWQSRNELAAGDQNVNTGRPKYTSTNTAKLIPCTAYTARADEINALRN